MSINKTITLTWEGKDYPLIINMYHIDRIEESGINLLGMANDCATRDLKLSKATRLITVLLQLAGAKGLEGSIEDAQEKVWEAMCSDGQASIADILILVGEILKVVFFRSKKKSTGKKKKKK